MVSTLYAYFDEYIKHKVQNAWQTQVSNVLYPQGVYNLANEVTHIIHKLWSGYINVYFIIYL